MVTIFETQHFQFYGRDEFGRVKQLAFYNGDLTDVDLATDVRFKAVGTIRKQAEQKGTVDSILFSRLFTR